MLCFLLKELTLKVRLEFSSSYFSKFAVSMELSVSYELSMENFERGHSFDAVQALMGLKASLIDPHGVLDNWDGDAVDPCSWTMVTCSQENLVIAL